MEGFRFRGQELYCEGVSVSRIARRVGTPVYVYSLGSFLDQFRKLERALAGSDHLICYSVKANSNLTLLKTLTGAGAGLDIVSGGELYRARLVGSSPEKIVYASVGKREEEIVQALRYGILMFNVESEEELEAINHLAGREKKKQLVALRINPDVKANTHRYITTGSGETKFGFDPTHAYRLFMESYRFPHLRLGGIHLHIGSQITTVRPFVEAIRKAMVLIDRLTLSGIPIETLNIGGGWGIVYSRERPRTAAGYMRSIRPLLKRGLRLILEPGRFIAGNGGILVTRLLYWKQSGTKRFAIVDAGMNDLLRPAFYGAYHEILPVHRNTLRPRLRKVDIVGPVCETGDFLGKERKLARLRGGDLLAVMSSGAYGFSMSSNYNSRCRVPEVVVRGKRFYVTRKRESYEDLVRHEKIVKI